MKVLIRALPELPKPTPPPPNSGTLVLFFRPTKTTFCAYDGNYLVEKKDQKIRAWVNPPPTFGQCPN